MRIYVTRQGGWTSREVTARVDLYSSLVPVSPLAVTRMVTSDSSVDNLASTFNLEIPVSYLAGDLTYQVSLREVGNETGDGDADRSRWPEIGAAAFDEENLGGGIELVIVPVQYDADGSGRLPDTSAEQLDMFKDYFYRYYPLPMDDIHITVGDPLSWNSAVNANGTGWEALLDAVNTLRNQRGATNKQYYYGAFSPDDSARNYCWQGCVVGLGYVPFSPGGGQWGGLAAIGVGWGGDLSAGTMIHEVGHNHGRLHAPCEVSDPDPDYPYGGGSIGVWGYDLLEKSLYNPSRYSDFMGYCENKWVSDYTFDGLAEWIGETNALPDTFKRLSRWRSLKLRSSGEILMGEVYDLGVPPGGEPMSITLFDIDGMKLGVETGYFTGYDHLPGGILLFPEPEGDVFFVSVAGSSPISL